MNIRTLSYLLCLSPFVPTISMAQEASGSAGAFLRLGVGARAGSLGDAFVAVANGPTALYWNPAGLMQNRGWQFEASQRRFAAARNFSFAALAFPISTSSALGFGWIGFTADGIEARSGNTPQPDGYFSDSENALLVSASHRLTDWLAAGMTLKGVTQKLFTESASGFSASLGVQWFLHDRLTLGATMQDFYSSYRWSNGRGESFPQTGMVGVAWRMTSQSLITVDYHETAHERGRLRAGLEFAGMASLPLRLGYSQNSFAAGAGLVTPLAAHVLRLDYHFASQNGINGQAHAFSIAIDFGAAEKATSSRMERDFIAVSKSTSQKTVNRSPITETVQAPGEITAQQVKKTLRIKASMLNVRSGPGTQYEIMAKRSQNEKIRAIRSWGDWYEIKLDENKRGWVNKEFVEER